MRSRFIVLLAASLFVLSGCFSSTPNGNEQTEPDVKTNRIDLPFAPVEAEALEETDPPVELVKVKSFGFSNISGKKQAIIHLYVAPEFKETQEQGEVIAFLEDKGRFYNLGMVTDYGIKNASVTVRDSNGDGNTEMELSGPLGSHYVELKVVAYDEKEEDWVILLKTGSPEWIDLDQDGRKELISLSRGTTPSYVWIYRWQKERYEMADVAKAVGGESARLVEKGERVQIEVATPNGTRLYRYEGGNLVEIVP